MPYKDPDKNKAYQAAWQRAKTGHKPRAPFRTEREDEEPLACWHRFHTTNPCRNRARFITVKTATRWCRIHAEGIEGLVPLDDPPPS